MENWRPRDWFAQDQARSVRNPERRATPLAATRSSSSFHVSCPYAFMVRLQKFLAEAGVASRRASEQFIVLGRVTVNGQTVTELGTKIDPARDKIAVDGKSLKPKRNAYIALNKPPGYICTRRDPESRKTM